MSNHIIHVRAIRRALSSMGNWKPSVKFDTRWQKVTHVAVELSANGAASENVSVSLVDGEDAANDFKIMVGSGTLASNGHTV